MKMAHVNPGAQLLIKRFQQRSRPLKGFLSDHEANLIGSSLRLANLLLVRDSAVPQRGFRRRRSTQTVNSYKFHVFHSVRILSTPEPGGKH
jgi:hypothetical protein